MEKWLTPPLVISLAAFCLAAINTHYSRKKDNKQEFNDRFDDLEKKLEASEKRLNECEASLKVLSMQMGLFWKTIEQSMARKFKDE